MSILSQRNYAQFVLACIITTNGIYIHPRNSVADIYSAAGNAVSSRTSSAAIYLRPTPQRIPSASTAMAVMRTLGMEIMALMLGLQFPIGRAQKDEFLHTHDAARATVGVGAMTWNSTVAAYAVQWADHLRDRDNCTLVHSGGPYGENLYWSSSTSATATDAVNAWVAEKAYYNYTSNTCAAGEVCGHYTQVVWANSHYLGCARIACNNGEGVLVMCCYNPPGNYVGQRPY